MLPTHEDRLELSFLLQLPKVELDVLLRETMHGRGHVSIHVTHDICGSPVAASEARQDHILALLAVLEIGLQQLRALEVRRPVSRIDDPRSQCLQLPDNRITLPQQKRRRNKKKE